MKKPIRAYDVVLIRKVKITRGKLTSNQLLTIGGIERMRGNDEMWVCRWAITCIDEGARPIAGIDALAALVNCVEFIKLLLARYNEAGIDVWWLKKGDCGGLLVDENDGNQ